MKVKDALWISLDSIHWCVQKIIQIETIMPINESNPSIRDTSGKGESRLFRPAFAAPCSLIASFFAEPYLLLSFLLQYLKRMSRETLKKITSKASIMPNQGGSFTDVVINAPVARTAPITTGSIDGKTSSGNNNSRACVVAAVAEIACQWCQCRLCQAIQSAKVHL